MDITEHTWIYHPAMQKAQPDGWAFVETIEPISRADAPGS
jgi:hypothetical protein